MKIKGRQLEMVLSKLSYFSAGWQNDTDFELEISLEKEDPGSGIMTDCFTLTAIKSKDDHSALNEKELEETFKVEIYPAQEQLEPRAVKTSTFKITKT